MSCYAALRTGARLPEPAQWADGTAPGFHAPFINTPSRSPEGSRNSKSNIKSGECSSQAHVQPKCAPFNTLLRYTRAPAVFQMHIEITHITGFSPGKKCVLVLLFLLDVAEMGRSSLFFVSWNMLFYRAPISFVTHHWMKALHVLRRPAERRHTRFCQNQWKCAVLMGICVFNSISLCRLDTSSKTAMDVRSCCFEW